MATLTDNDYGAFANAGATYPLDPASAQTLLRDADPAIFFALDFFSFLITHYVGDRLIAAAKGANFASSIPAAVVQRYPWDPDLELVGNQFKFPLLSIARRVSTHKRKTIGWEDDRSTFDLLYALPPLMGGQAEAVLPILRAVSVVLRHGTTQSFDPAYAPPGGNLGDSPWAVPFAGVEEFGFDSSTYGTMPGTGTLKFPALIMSGYIVERDFRLPGDAFAGGDITAALGGVDGPVMAQQATQQAPTITSVSPATGASAGGTVVTITGTLFLPGATVLFGSLHVLATVTTTTLTCAAPPAGGPGVVDVTVINGDGQTTTARGAFSYT